MPASGLQGDDTAPPAAQPPKSFTDRLPTMYWLSYAFLLVGLAGHLALWIAMFNRVHALGLPRRVVSATEKIHVAAICLVPLVWAIRWLRVGLDEAPWSALFAGRPFEAAYFLVSCLFFLHVAIRWARRRWSEATPDGVRTTAEEHYDVRRELGRPLVAGVTARLLAGLPCNQMTQLSVNEKEFELARLHPNLDGLTIAHLSDLHFTGKLKRAYFDFIIERTNELQADLVVVTGDIIDKDVCLPWIEPTLGRLQSRWGSFFILGNHDKRVSDVAGLRRLLVDCGLTDLGGRSQMLTVSGCQLLLVGNEQPWLGSLPQPPPPGEQQDPPTLRVLLSHSPDQVTWARQQQFDLMLAGHTHGGQIRFPLLGPLVAPSRFGVKYAGGVYAEPPLLMHVSRGISGLDPIRINCRPELTRLVLRTPVRSTSGVGQIERAAASLATPVL